MTDYVIEINDLRRSYKGTEALRGLNLHVKRGSVYGFLGRNGAGKTTTIKTMMGLLNVEHGQIRVLGMPVTPRNSVEIHRRTGFVGEDKDLYPYLTVDEMVRFTRSFFPQWRDDIEKRCPRHVRAAWKSQDRAIVERQPFQASSSAGAFAWRGTSYSR